MCVYVIGYQYSLIKIAIHRRTYICLEGLDGRQSFQIKKNTVGSIFSLDLTPLCGTSPPCVGPHPLGWLFEKRLKLISLLSITPLCGCLKRLKLISLLSITPLCGCLKRVKLISLLSITPLCGCLRKD